MTVAVGEEARRTEASAMETSPAEVHFSEAAEKMIYYTVCCLSLNAVPTESKRYDEREASSVLVLSTRHTRGAFLAGR